MQKSVTAVMALAMLAGSAAAQLVVGRDGTNAEVLVIDLAGGQPVRTLASGIEWKD